MDLKLPKITTGTKQVLAGVAVVGIVWYLVYRYKKQQQEKQNAANNVPKTEDATAMPSMSAIQKQAALNKSQASFRKNASFYKTSNVNG